MTRAERLQERFNTIQQTIQELYGEEVATCAASAAWLRAAQYGAEQSMKQLKKFVSDGVARVAYDEDLERFDKEHELMLQGFHKWLCQRLGVDPAIALRHSEAFEQVIKDICYQRG